jgi:hypothetical protein
MVCSEVTRNRRLSISEDKRCSPGTTAQPAGRWAGPCPDQFGARYNDIMRTSGGLLLIVLIVAAVVLLLRVQEVEHVHQGVERMVPHLEEQGVEPTVMRRSVALERVDELEDLCDHHSDLKDRVPWLVEVAREAASWAAGAPAPSAELSAALSIRKAANNLRDFAAHGRESARDRARRNLSDARRALSGEALPSSTTDGLRDRMKNLEESHRERFQELEDEL